MIFKKIFSGLLITFILSLLLLVPLITIAQVEYVPISPIEGFTEKGSNTSLEGFLQNAFKFALGIATILAILKVAQGGIQYMTSKSAGGSEEAKSTISNAIIGLLLILSTFIILNQINPDILEFKLGVPKDTTTSTSPNE